MKFMLNGITFIGRVTKDLPRAHASDSGTGPEPEPNRPVVSTTVILVKYLIDLF